MCGYKAFFNGKTTEIHANTLFQAKQKAVAFFKPPKSKQHLVHVVLCEKEGETVTHSTTEL